MAANVLDNLANWSTTDSSNQPDGSDAADIDAELRRIQSVVRKYTRTIGANIASASTVDLSAATGDVITVTGTTTITGLGTVSAGMRFWLVFSGALTLTHNGTSLILPGAANITTVAGDVACFESLGSGNWRCLAYTKNTTPTVYASTGANSDITSLTGLTTPLSVAQGGTGAINLNALAKVAVENTWTAQQAPMSGVLTDGATITWAASAIGQVATLTLAGNRTMGAPTGVKQFALYLLRVTQDASGSRTLSWDTAFKFGTAGAPTLTTTASKTDILSFVGGSGNTLEYIGIRKDAI